jgi:hypothetical protein
MRLNTIEAYADVPRPPGASIPRGSVAGVDVALWGTSVLKVDRVEFLQNTIKRVGGTLLSAAGGGLYVRAEGTSAGDTGGTATVRHSRFAENSVAAGSLDGGGEALFGSVGSRARLKVEDTTFEANGLVSRNLSTVSLNASGYIATTSFAIDLFRCRFLGNGSEWQLDTSVLGDYGRIRVADGLVANGLGGGVRAISDSGGWLYLTNLTVTGHPGMGVRTLPYAFIGVFNTLAWNNHGGDLVGMYTSAVGNLVGVDPLFVDPAAFDYTLSLASPAIDEGDNARRSLLYPTDLAGNPRIVNGRVDIGAFERAQ